MATPNRDPDVETLHTLLHDRMRVAVIPAGAVIEDCCSELAPDGLYVFKAWLKDQKPSE